MHVVLSEGILPDVIFTTAYKYVLHYVLHPSLLTSPYLRNDLCPLVHMTGHAGQVVQQVPLLPLVPHRRVEVVVVNIHHVGQRKYALAASPQIYA